MHTQSLRNFLSTSLITLSLASFALAGDVHCPVVPPPPPPGEGGLVAMQVGTDDSMIDQMIKGFWEFLGSDIF